MKPIYIRERDLPVVPKHLSVSLIDFLAGCCERKEEESFSYIARFLIYNLYKCL